LCSCSQGRPVPLPNIRRVNHRTHGVRVPHYPWPRSILGAHALPPMRLNAAGIFFAAMRDGLHVPAAQFWTVRSVTPMYRARSTFSAGLRLWNASLHSGVTPGALVLLMHLTYLATRPKSSEKMRADFHEMLLTSRAPRDRLEMWAAIRPTAKQRGRDERTDQSIGTQDWRPRDVWICNVRSRWIFWI
jgi:hypothetical protein